MQHSANSVSDYLLERLEQSGVRRIFGISGDGINGVMGALERAGDRFEFVQVAHEEVAAFAARAHAKFTGEVGVCLSTSGPGAVHLLNGLYDARLDRRPGTEGRGQRGSPPGEGRAPKATPTGTRGGARDRTMKAGREERESGECNTPRRRRDD